MLQRKKTVKETIQFCSNFDYIFCTDMHFFMNDLQESHLPLFHGVKIMVSEEMMKILTEQRKSSVITKRKKARHALRLLNELSVIGEILLIPSTSQHDQFNFYCYRLSLDYKQPSDRILGYYLKWNEEGLYRLLFVTSDKKTYKQAKRKGFMTELIQN
ncbi:hypothetical protein [Cytobacillus oceanisediminis]|uniref:hypothetical protein n=1 Tax=Cytobacillus oceanisediminis TaxID=665099 RepID=UPI000FAA239E|nr:hypothetical protein [Cytobacillus oceanisediminis]MDK7667439.1 hypothetical protein [Cytobacillus oceanisediminis]